MITMRTTTTATQTFANALVNTGDNKYKLSKLFFPIDDISPIQVEITYNSTSNATEPRVWYWIKGGFYEFQPFQLFELRSLFLATPSWRKSLSLVLPNNCFAENNKTNSNKAHTTIQYNGSIDNLHSHNFLYTWFGYCCASYGKQK